MKVWRANYKGMDGVALEDAAAAKISATGDPLMHFLTAETGTYYYAVKSTIALGDALVPECGHAVPTVTPEPAAQGPSANAHLTLAEYFGAKPSKVEVHF